MNYTDGQEVKKAVLFTIDDRTYRATLNRRRQRWQEPKRRPARRKARQTVPINWSIPIWYPVKSGEQRRAAPSAAQADIRAAQAAVDAAQLNLDFTKVTAPSTGAPAAR